VNEAACGSIGRERGEGYAGLGAFGDLHWSLVAAHLGFDPAGVGGVDLNRGVFELPCEVDRVGVERGLRSVIGKGLEAGDGAVGVCVQGVGAEDAREVDDTACR